MNNTDQIMQAMMQQMPQPPKVQSTQMTPSPQLQQGYPSKDKEGGGMMDLVKIMMMFMMIFGA